MKRSMSGSDSCEDALADDVYAYVTQNSYPIGCSGSYCQVCTEPKRADAGRSGLSRGRNVRPFWGR